MIISRVVPESLNRQRIDFILKELKLAESRNQALGLIISGRVFVDNIKTIKPGKIIKSNAIIKLKKNDYKWVSRGGIKLEHALKKLDVDVFEKISLDVGCSTGGFTDVLLQRGVKKVYGVDVGYGQFDWKLRNSDRVILLERTNARNINKKIIPELIDLVVCDVSFISIKKVLIPIKKILSKKYEIVALIKPQFEATKSQIGRGGIIKDSLLHRTICEDIFCWTKENFNNRSIEIIESPISGQKGNKEFFIYVKN